MENNQNAVDSSFSDASLPVELLTTSAVEVFDDFFAPDWASSALLTWTPTFQTNEPIKITSRICSKVFQSLNLSQSLQYYASNRSCKYNSEYIHLSQFSASLHMTRCTPGFMSIMSLTCNGTPQKKGCSPHGLQLQRQPLRWVCGIVGIQNVAILVSGILWALSRCIFTVCSAFQNGSKQTKKHQQNDFLVSKAWWWIDILEGKGK